MKTHGDEGWNAFPSFLALAVPRALAMLRKKALRATFFAVGKDALMSSNRDTIAAIADAGHEVGNHSFRHDPWLHLYTEREIDEEIGRAEQAILAATSQRPVGFRGPGHSLTGNVLSAVARRGYAYDASTWPTFVMPIVRAYYFSTGRFTKAQKRQRRRMGGTVREGLRPLRPYRWVTEAGALLELPVATLPVLRLPFHMTYLHLLAGRSKSLALSYLRFCLLVCRRGNIAPSFLLHATDFIGEEDHVRLPYVPGMTVPVGEKAMLTERAVDILCSMCEVLPLAAYSRLLEKGVSLPERCPDVDKA